MSGGIHPLQHLDRFWIGSELLSRTWDTAQDTHPPLPKYVRDGCIKRSPYLPGFSPTVSRLLHQQPPRKPRSYASGELCACSPTPEEKTTLSPDERSQVNSTNQEAIPDMHNTPHALSSLSPTSTISSKAFTMTNFDCTPWVRMEPRGKIESGDTHLNLHIPIMTG